MRRVAVVGQAQTKYTSHNLETHVGELIYEATVDALKDAEVSIDDIDTVVSASCDVLDGRSISNVFVAEAMGAFMKEES